MDAKLLLKALNILTAYDKYNDLVSVPYLGGVQLILKEVITPKKKKKKIIENYICEKKF